MLDEAEEAPREHFDGGSPIQDRAELDGSLSPALTCVGFAEQVKTWTRLHGHERDGFVIRAPGDLRAA
jgi:hypothetical protein